MNKPLFSTLLLIVVAGIAGYFLATKKYGVAQESPTPTVVASPTTSKSPAPTQSVPAGYKAYSSDTYGFQVYIPLKWTSRVISNGVAFDAPSAQQASNMVTVVSNTQQKTIKTIENELRSNPNIAEVYTDLKIDGQQAVRFTNNDGIPVQTAQVIYGGKIYSITGWLLNSEIISTFKFTK